MFGRVLLIALAAACLWAVVARSSEGAGKPAVYVVKPHDTLWSIAAARYAGDTREGIWRIERANGLDGALVRPGQRLVLP